MSSSECLLRTASYCSYNQSYAPIPAVPVATVPTANYIANGCEACYNDEHCSHLTPFNKCKNSTNYYSIGINATCI